MRNCAHYLSSFWIYRKNKLNEILKSFFLIHYPNTHVTKIIILFCTKSKNIYFCSIISIDYGTN
ncbi:hypothetical protein HMPREF9446_03023 [Bacteroides fluxus YIT 12057]|uniref:Uncharacterized protein n=1 Tax=Bacteroides fluxus YIT 12057 TaxID=763034 RepID=F3PW87_9BACE|nr:hypothetical protein HMPREF9446_03023 [Bacteroides fluxus YIT 12057]